MDTFTSIGILDPNQDNIGSLHVEGGSNIAYASERRMDTIKLIVITDAGGARAEIFVYADELIEAIARVRQHHT